MSDLGQFNPNKVLCHHEKVSALLKGENVYPVVVEINPTNLCNHNCIWCTYGYLRGDENNQDSLDKETLLTIVEQLSGLDVKSIIWTGGGEPLMNKHVFEAMRLAARKGFDQAIHTNGGIMTDELADFIIASFTYLRVSLDAATEETHHKLHCSPRGDFDRILRHLKLLVEKKKEKNSQTTIGTSFLLHPENYREAEKAVEILKEIGVDYLQFKPIILWGAKEQLDPAYLKEALIKIEELKNANSDFKILSLDYKFFDYIKDHGRFGRNYKKCLGHSLIGSIGANGSVDLCCSFKGLSQWSFGNIKEKSFKEIWEGQKRKEVIEKINLAACEPMCRVHEINKLLDYMKNYNYHKNFI